MIYLPFTSPRRRCEIRGHEARHHATRRLLHRAGWTWSSPSRPSSTSSSRCRGGRRRGARCDTTRHRCRQTGAVEDGDSELAARPAVALSSRHRQGPRRRARHDATATRRRQAGAMEDEAAEPALTPPAIVVVKPALRRTTTQSSSSHHSRRSSSSRWVQAEFNITQPITANSFMCPDYAAGAPAGGSLW